MKKIMKKKIKINTMNESDLQRIYNSPMNPRDSRISIQIKDLYILIMVVWVELIELVL